MQHAKLAIFLLVTTLLLLFVITVVGRFSLWDGEETYYLVSEESVLGLDEGAPVSMRGVGVGRVANIELDPRDYASVRIALELDDEVPVPSNAVAFIRMNGLTGGKVVDIDQGDLQSGVLPPGSIIPLEPTALDKIEDQALELAESAATVMKNAEMLTENLAQLSEALDQEQIAGVVDRTDDILRKVDAAATDLRQTMRAGRAGIGNISSTASDLGKLVRRANSMLKGNERDLRAAMRNLRQAARNLQDFSRQVKNQPSKILRSKPAAERELP